MMPESYVEKWQKLNNDFTYLVNVAKELKVNIMPISPTLNGKLLDLKLSRTDF